MKFLNVIFFSFLCIQPVSNLKADAAGKIAMLAGGSLAIGGSVMWIKMEQKLMNAKKEKQETLGDFFRYAAEVGGISAGKNIAAVVAIAGTGLFIVGASKG